MHAKEGDTTSRRKLQYVLTVYAPVKASLSEVKDFIESSLCWAGGDRLPPGQEGYPEEGDPLFDSLDKVTARRITQFNFKRRK